MPACEFDLLSCSLKSANQAMVLISGTNRKGELKWPRGLDRGRQLPAEKRLPPDANRGHNGNREHTSLSLSLSLFRLLAL